ncbi:MAG: tyrosine-type recombinase/integrase [Candidatus Kapabacteria bacterium]|nr:tyrosine-type recombinase/integrase [Candidatus Kapabacteria bacterium]
MRLSFYLDKPERQSSSIMLNVALGGKRFRFGTGVIIDPKHWNAEKGSVRSTDPHRNANQKKLNHISEFVRTCYNELIPSGKEKILSSDDLANFTNRIRTFLSPTEDTETTRPRTFEQRFEEFIKNYTIRTRNGMITSNRPGPRMLSLYRLVLNDILAWSAARRRPLSFETINEDFHADYCSWLLQERGLVDATVSNHTKVIKTFMKWARQKGYHTETGWENFWRDKRTAKSIALTLDELHVLRDADLSGFPKLDRTRNLFLIQAFTGLRYGDVRSLEPGHFDDDAGVIRFITEKTDAKCTIPITAPLAKLLEQFPTREFRFPTNQEMNRELKVLGEHVGFDKTSSVSHYQAGKRIESKHQRFELLTTHVARSTYISTSIRFGIPEAVTSIATGHASKGMMQTYYIILSEEAVRDMVCKAWEQL